MSKLTTSWNVIYQENNDQTSQSFEFEVVVNKLSITQMCKAMANNQRFDGDMVIVSIERIIE